MSNIEKFYILVILFCSVAFITFIMLIVWMHFQMLWLHRFNLQSERQDNLIKFYNQLMNNK